jgi:hypothetical protein
MDNNVRAKKRGGNNKGTLYDEHLRGTRHRMEMISLCDVHWLLVCVDEFRVMKLKT